MAIGRNLPSIRRVNISLCIKGRLFKIFFCVLLSTNPSFNRFVSFKLNTGKYVQVGLLVRTSFCYRRIIVASRGNSSALRLNLYLFSVFCQVVIVFFFTLIITNYLGLDIAGNNFLTEITSKFPLPFKMELFIFPRLLALVLALFTISSVKGTSTILLRSVEFFINVSCCCNVLYS